MSPTESPTKIVDDMLAAFPTAGKGTVEPGAVPAGFRVTAIYHDPDGKRYRSMGDWIVKTRSGDVVVGHRFHTEAEALAFAATSESVE